MIDLEPHCRVCPRHLNTAKQLSLAVKALRNINNSEAREVLQQIRVLADLKEPPLCAPCEVSP